MVVTDFTTGAGGDRLDLTSVLGRLAQLGYDYGNPFTTGWLRLTASGADTLLQVDLNGATDGGSWQTLAPLQGTQATAFTSANFVDDISPTGFALGQDKTGTDGDTMVWAGERALLRIDIPRQANATYPDDGRSLQIYTNADPVPYVELETIAPLHTLQVNDRASATNTYRLAHRTRAPLEDDVRALLAR